MRVRAFRAGALVTVVSCGVLGTAALPAAAAPSVPAGTGSVRINHFNVGATHSPQVLSQFAGTSSTGGVSSGAMSPATPASSVIAGAVQGIDVASYQEAGGIDWPKVYAAGKRFAAIKVTEGTYYTNPYASADLTAAKRAGLAVLAYAFAIPNGDGGSASPAVQADYAIAHGRGLYQNLPPVMLDIEYDPYATQDGTNKCYGLSESAMVSWIRGFVSEVQAKTGQLPIIYSTQQWWSACTGNSTAFGQDPLWIASYSGSATPGTLPAGWSTWTYWQYGQSTTTTPVPGISGTTDLDQADPSLLTFLDPGNQQDVVGTSGVSLQLMTSQSTGVTYSASALPGGLSLQPTGLISGSVPSAGQTTVTVTATNSAAPTPASVSVTFTWYVHGTVTVTAPPDRSTVAGSPVDVAAASGDSVAGQTPSFTAAGLPRGVSISRAGLMTGWPYAPGTYHVALTARDSLEAYGTASFTWTVTAAPDRGPTGRVRLALGKCLNDVGNRSRNGTEADLWSCNTSAAQRWTYVPDGTLRIHGKCLTAPSHAGWKVRLETCDGAASRQWLLLYPRSVNSAAGGQAVALVNPASRRCLSDQGWSRSNGTRVVVESCNGNRNQVWTLPAGPVASQVPGKCVDDRNNYSYNGNKIQVWTCDGQARQRWTVEPDGTVRIHGKCLTVAHASRSAGAKVWLWRCFGGKDQHWHLVRAGADAELVNPVSRKCLSDPGNSTRNGNWLRIEPCSALPGQVWRAQ